MKKQQEIPMVSQAVPQYKLDFLAWLNRYAHVSRQMRSTLTRHTFTVEELNRLRPQIARTYRLKKKYLEKAGA